MHHSRYDCEMWTSMLRDMSTGPRPPVLCTVCQCVGACTESCQLELKNMLQGCFIVMYSFVMEVFRHAELIVEWFLWTIEHTNRSLDIQCNISPITGFVRYTMYYCVQLCSVLSGLECSDFVQWLRQASLSAACTVCNINVRQGLID